MCMCSFCGYLYFVCMYPQISVLFFLAALAFFPLNALCVFTDMCVCFSFFFRFLFFVLLYDLQICFLYICCKIICN